MLNGQSTEILSISSEVKWLGNMRTKVEYLRSYVYMVLLLILVFIYHSCVSQIKQQPIQFQCLKSVLPHITILSPYTVVNLLC